MAGLPSARQPSSCRHRSEEPPQTRAPHVGWMTIQAGLLTRGSMLRFRLPGPESPVAMWKRTRRLQLRAQLRNWPTPHRIPISLISRPTNLNPITIDSDPQSVNRAMRRLLRSSSEWIAGACSLFEFSGPRSRGRLPFGRRILSSKEIALQRRHDHEQHDRPDQHSADDDRRKRSLHLAADAGGERGRQQADAG